MNEQRDLRRAGGAGMIAAIVMVAAQLAWRTLASNDGVVQAFPEFIAAAVARLTPVSLFGAITENYGSWAKRSLLATCVLGIVVVGIWAGRLAWRIAGPPAPTFARRLLGGLAAAALLLAATLVVILPVAHLGIAARSSSYTSSILTQLIITFALFGLVFATLTGEPQSIASADGQTYSRRAFAMSGAWFAFAIGGCLAIIATMVNMFRTKPLTAAQIAAQQDAVQQIIETQTAASPTALLPSGAQLFAMAESEGHLTPILTETHDFYHVSKNFTDPTVNGEGWSLEIGGAVATPLSFTLDQLTQMATTRKITTLCCISNEINGGLI
ncbi:MAG TPA: molybdopterin-dependent oxidoreductase, partial [Thermomicrobiales bacterium]|nr:molybdopterin-dependent oxidoreductase [Thermomicrobiales bacterium]